MTYYVEQAVRDLGVKIVFAEIEGFDNQTDSPEWNGQRAERLAKLVAYWTDRDLHEDPVLEGFHLTAYGHRAQMQRSNREAAGHPLRGAPALGHALEWTLEKVLLATPLLQRAQVLFAIVASETSSWDREKLRTLSLRPSARASLCLCWPWARAWGPASWQSWSTWPAPPRSTTCYAWKGAQRQRWLMPWASRGPS